MDKLTFRDEIGQREFVVLRSTTPIVMFQEQYFTVSQVFPYIHIIDWRWGFMITDRNTIIVSEDAPECIKLMNYCKVCQLIINNLN